MSPDRADCQRRLPAARKRIDDAHTQPYSVFMSRVRKTRLSRTDWIDEGFATLAEEGPEALKAEPLARRLGATKGSFYWHFKDVPDFHSAMLAAWEDRADPPEDEEGTAPARLRRIAAWLGDADPQDAALRAWAKADDTVERVDGARMDRLAELLRESGIDNPEMAQILYATSVGMRSLRGGEATTGPEAMASLVDLILALR
jgi:AcrR family transcriptional regulator